MICSVTATVMSLCWSRVIIGSVGDSPKGRRNRGGRQLGLSRYPAGETVWPIGLSKLSR